MVNLNRVKSSFDRWQIRFVDSDLTEKFPDIEIDNIGLRYCIIRETGKVR